MPFARFVHLFGMSLWIGGMVTAMVLIVGARAEGGSSKMTAFRWTGRIYSLVVGPGALLTVLTGLLLTMSLAQRMGSEAMARPGIWVMQVAGLVAGVLVLFVAIPTAANLARMAAEAGEGEPPPAFEKMRKRLSAVAHAVALLVVVALFFVTVVR